MKNIQILYFTLIIALLNSCSLEHEYEIKDSGYNASEQSVNWVDNNRVIFVSYKNNQGSIYLWNTDTGTIDLYADEAMGGICFGDGIIKYSTKDDRDKAYLKFGRFGGEEEIVLFKKDKKTIENKSNRYTCKRFTPPPELRDQRVFYLKEDHGYLHIGPNAGSDFDYPIYVRQDGRRITMPFSSLVTGPPNGFYLFKEAYFMWAVRSGGPGWNKNCQAIWWIYPDGQTESICMPLAEGVNAGSVLMYPVKMGYLQITHDSDRNGPGPSGIYLLNQRAEFESKLIDGVATGISISPDGCKVAFRHNPVVQRIVTLKVINLCKSD